MTDARFARRWNIVLAVVCVALGIGVGFVVGVGFMTNLTSTDNKVIDLPLISKKRSPNGELTAYLFNTRSSSVVVSVHSVVYISKSHQRPRRFDLVFDSERARDPTLKWKNDNSLVLGCEKGTRIMRFVNWWWFERDDDALASHAVGVGITCGREGWVDP